MYKKTVNRNLTSDIVFVCFSSSGFLKTMVTPLTQKYFNFGELENSVMYCVCGVEVIAGFLFVHWLSRRAAERVVLAIGLAICNVSSVWCLIFLANPIGPSARHSSTPSHTVLSLS